MRTDIKRGMGVVLFPLTGGTEDRPPTNPRLYGQPALVVAVTAWGAVVQPMDGGPTYRAGWGEMVVPTVDGATPVDALDGGGTEGGRTAPAPRGGVGRNGVHRPSGEPTGDCCAACGSANMARAGTCLRCNDCGDTSGGCG